MPILLKRRLWWLLLAAGLALALCALAALLYAALPVEMLAERIPLAPTVFVSP